MRALGAVLLASVALTAGAAGCASNAAQPDNCPNDLPPACPSPAPGFAADANPVIQAHCATAACHSPTGVESVRPFQTYQEVYDQRVSILTQLHACKMPPAGEPPLTEPERLAVLGWLVCMAPND